MERNRREDELQRSNGAKGRATLYPEGGEKGVKLKISYLPEEEALAQGLMVMLQTFFKKCKVKQAENHPPQRHIYVSVGSAKHKQ